MSRYSYNQENITLMERSKLVCTQADMTNLKDRMQKMDNVESCTQEKTHTKWKIYKRTNFSFFASFLKNVSMGSEDTVLPERLSKNHNVNCFFWRETRDNPTMTISVCLKH